MENYLSFAPHIKKKTSANKMYLTILLSLVPAFIAGSIFFGVRSILILLVSVASVVGSEIAFNFCKFKKFVFNDYSTILVGVLIALVMPPKIPILYPVVGAVLSNILVKNCMGGVGRSIVNEVAFAKIITFVVFSNTAGCYMISETGAQTSMTLLGSVISGAEINENMLTILLGGGTGAVGENAILFLLIGGIVLCVMQLVDFKISLFYLLSTLVMSLICFGSSDALILLMSGGVVLCAFYLLTDYACAPKTLLGKLIYGISAGLVTVLYWKFGKAPDLGAFYAVLIVGIVANAIKGIYRPRIVGEKR